MKIRQRYFLKEMNKVFFLFLFCFYGLYVLIDYSTHTESFRNYHFSFYDILGLYLYEFVMRMDILVPFALLIACIKVLTSLNAHNELVALMAGGIPLRKILSPFIYFGLFLTLIMYMNTEFIQPKALKYQKQIDLKRSQAKHKKHNHLPIQQLALDDGSSIIFQDYDETNQELYDVYWIRSIDDIIRMRSLFPFAETPFGVSVEHLVRDKDDRITLQDFAREENFSQLKFDKTKLQESVTSPSDLSLSTLYQKSQKQDSLLSEKQAKILSTFYYKLIMPWSCLLAILAPAPFCIRFSRMQPIFFIFAGCISGLVSFYLIMDAGLILGERQVLSPLLALGLPFALFFSFFSFRYINCCFKL